MSVPPPQQPAAADPPGMTTRVMSGSVWAIAGQGLTLAATLVATPFTIRALGAESYGILTLIGLLIGYASIADLGMGAASTKFAAEAHAEGDAHAESQAVWTSTLVALLGALVIAGALVLAARPILVRAFNLGAGVQEVAVLSLRLAAIGLVARCLANVLNTPQLVRLRMDINVSINTVTALMQILLVPAVLLLGGGLAGAVAVTVLTAVLNATFNWIYSRRLLPELGRPGMRADLLRPMLAFGLGMVLSGIIALVLLNVEKLVLTAYASPAALAHYAVATTVGGLVTQAPSAITSALLPLFARFRQRGDMASFQLLYTRALRVIIVWMLPVMLVVAVAARPFLSLWAGEEYGRESTTPLHILLVGIFFQVLSRVPKEIIKAYGRPDLFSKYVAAELLPYLALAVPLTVGFGAAGAAIAWSARFIAECLLFFRAAHRLSGLRFQPFKGRRGIIGAMCALVPPLALMPFVDGWGTGTALALTAAAALAAYVIVAWRWVLADDERAWLMRMLTRFRRSSGAGPPAPGP